MIIMVSEDLGSKKLDDMKVVELRAALEKRNLDKTGVKSILIARLKEAMACEENESHVEEEASEPNAEGAETENGNHIIGDDSIEDEKATEELPNNKDSEVVIEEEETKNNEDIEPKDVIVTEEKEQINENMDEKIEEIDNDKITQENGHEEKFESTEEQVTEQPKEDSAAVIVENDSEIKADEVQQEITEDSTEKTANDEEECNLYQDLDHEQIVYEGDEIQEEESKQNKVTETAGNIEDAIDFMVDEDDNMLDEEMIFEDGSSNKGISESGGSNNKEQNSTKGGGRSARGTEASREQGASGSSGEKSSSSRSSKSSSSHNNKNSSSSDGAHKSTSGDSKRRSDGCSLWITGLTSATKAQDLKSFLSKYGKVTAAKIVTSAKTPGSKCFGFATMSSAEEVSRCIKNLNKTELDGKIINVEKAKGASTHRSSTEHKSEGKSDDKTEKTKETEGKEDAEKSGDGERKDESRRGSRTSRETSNDRKRRSHDGSHRGGNRGSNPRHNHRRSPLRAGGNRDNRRSPIRRRNDRDGRSLGLNQIMEERDRERMRVHQRIARDDERNDRGGGDARQRIVERRQREEADRLQRERQQLRAERERIERQKNELLRLEREQQRIEREKLEREREELRRHQMKLQQTSMMGGGSSRYSEDVRGPRGSMKRPAEPGHRIGYEPDRKRPAMGSRGGGTQDRYGGDYPPAPRITTPVQRNGPPQRKYDSSDRSSHRYESGGGGGGNSSHFYSREESGGRFDRNTANSTNKISGNVGGGDNSRWMGGGSTTNISGGNRRSDDYYSDRRGSDRPTNTDSRAPRSSGVNYSSQGGGNAISGGGMSRQRGGSDRYHQGAVTAPIASTTGWRVSSSSSSGRWESRDSSSHTSVPVRGAISSSNSSAPPYATESINDFISRSVNIMPMPQGHHQGANALQQSETLNNRGYVLPSNSYRKY